MKNNLVDRYLYAVSKELPQKMCKDVEEELKSLIMDMAEERCTGEEPTEDIILEILEELGHPAEMAEQYQTDGKRALISREYYGDYLFVLKIVLICMMGGAILTWVVGAVVTASLFEKAAFTEAVVQSVAELLNGIFQGLCIGFTFVTVIFAVLQRNGFAVRLRQATSIKELPDIPEKNAVIKKSDAAAQMIFGVMFSVILLSIPDKMMTVDQNGVVIEILNSEGIRNGWYLLIMISVLAAVEGLLGLYEGRYTKRYAVADVVINAVTFIIFCIFWFGRQILSPEFLEMGRWDIGIHLTEETFNMVVNLPILIAGILFVVMLITCGSTVWKAWKYDN